MITETLRKLLGAKDAEPQAIKETDYGKQLDATKNPAINIKLVFSNRSGHDDEDFTKWVEELT